MKSYVLLTRTGVVVTTAADYKNKIIVFSETDVALRCEAFYEPGETLEENLTYAVEVEDAARWFGVTT